MLKSSSSLPAGIDHDTLQQVNSRSEFLLNSFASSYLGLSGIFLFLMVFFCLGFLTAKNEISNGEGESSGLDKESS